jgi:aryl-alcohol dehydrogenase-like predicted oxidoreductase
MATCWQTGVSGAAGRDESAFPEDGSDRPLAIAPHRSSGTRRRVSGSNCQTAAGRQGPPVGLSEVKPAEIDQARKVVDIVSVQNLYNVGDRQHEDVVEHCEKHGLAFIPWFPVAAGKLAQPGGKLDAIAKRHGVTVAQLSIAWLLHRSPVMLPIPGTSSVAHLEENLKAAEISLSDADLKEIENPHHLPLTRRQ